LLRAIGAVVLTLAALAPAAAQNAANQAQLLTRPPTYSPITNLFSEVTGHLSNQMNYARARTGDPWDWSGARASDPVNGARGSVRELR